MPIPPILIAGLAPALASLAAGVKRGSRATLVAPRLDGVPVVWSALLKADQDEDVLYSFYYGEDDDAPFLFIPTREEQAAIEYLSSKYMTPEIIYKSRGYIRFSDPNLDPDLHEEDEDGFILAYRLTPTKLKQGMILDGSDRINAFSESSGLNKMAWLVAPHEPDDRISIARDMLLEQAGLAKNRPIWLGKPGVEEAFATLPESTLVELWQINPDDTVKAIERKIIKMIRGKPYMLGKRID